METKPPEQHSAPMVIQHFLVAYLDVLGQRNDLRRLATLPRNQEELRETSAVLKCTLGFVLQLRSLFKIFFDGYGQPSDFVKSLPEADQRASIELRRSEVHMYGFSDSFVVSVPLRSNDDHCTPVNGVFAALWLRPLCQ